MLEEINIILAADNPYTEHLGVTLRSLIDNFVSNDYKPIIHILDGGLSWENKEKIKTLATGEKSELLFHEVNQALFSDFPEPGHLKVPTYFRLIIPEIIDPKIKKVLYLDSDLVIFGNILSLYLENVEDYIFGAIKDASETTILKEPYQITIEKFFNAGVLLINLGLWRKYKISEQANDFIKSNYDKLKGADQDAFNYVMQNLP